MAASPHYPLPITHVKGIHGPGNSHQLSTRNKGNGRGEASSMDSLFKGLLTNNNYIQMMLIESYLG
jgi:hypothetical protein